MTDPNSTAVSRARFAAFTLLWLPFALSACGGGEKPKEAPGAPSVVSNAAEGQQPDAPLPPPPAFETVLPENIREGVSRSMTGDLDEMYKRRVIRIGVTSNRTFYFVDRGVQRGVLYDYGRFLEEQINKKLDTGNMKVFVFFVPMSRDQLLQALLDGKVDLVAAQITVRPEAEKLVDFTNPTRSNVSQVVVTGPGAAPLASVDDLSGRDVVVRKLSSYHDSLVSLNEKLKAKGKPPVNIRDAPETLEDDDLLEMVNAGLIQATVVDNYLAGFWKKVFTNMTVHDSVPVRTGGTLAVAIRKNSPQLKVGLNTFMANYGLGTAFGDQVERRYLVSTRYAKSATSEEDRRKFMAMVDLFRKYGAQYDMDFLLMAAQGYQESALNNDARSPVGAIGLMQVMPATGAELNVGDITVMESNVHAGVKYMRFLEDQFFKNEPMDALNKTLFTFAAYNAGPGRVRQLRKEAEKRGLNPNVWLGNVELIASERIGRETVTYVSNIYKYYIAYKLVMEEVLQRNASKAAMKGGEIKK